MSLRCHLIGRALLPGILISGILTPALAAQAPQRPQPYCIRGVSLDREGEHKGTLLLRDGVISAILDESAPAPAGTRVIDGTGLICLPAFLDAFSRSGSVVAEPVKDQDIPPDQLKDVGIDMRLANRKGIQPAFGAVEALDFTKEQGEAWRKSGFGALLVAPGGELLSGSSALLATRAAAHRDVVVRDSVFAHGTFAANGPGYPRTLMGFFAQLRQFFLDSRRHVQLEERFARGRPGLRPPHDAELEAGAAILSGERPLLCEAKESDDIERWLRLADEFDLRLDVVGGLEAWRVKEILAEREMTVVLTLDWGEEVDDPRPDEDDEAGDEAGDEAAAEEPGEEVAEAAEEGAAEGAPAGIAAEAAASDEPLPEYQEPFEVRVERRLKWERNRDCALRLHESGVRFVFGTASRKPEKLLGSVRELVESGLSAETALAALTSEAAGFLGVGERLGRIAPGFDATFALWRSDPLTDDKASVAWTFVDGFPSEFKEDKKKGKGDGPAEGVDPTGTWLLEFEVEGEGMRSATLVIEMDEDGVLSGTIEVENPMGGARVETEIEGQVEASELELECTLSFGEFEIEATLTASIDGDELDGKGSFKGPWSEEPEKQSFTGKRSPK